MILSPIELIHKFYNRFRVITIKIRTFCYRVFIKVIMIFTPIKLICKIHNHFRDIINKIKKQWLRITIKVVIYWVCSMLIIVIFLNLKVLYLYSQNPTKYECTINIYEYYKFIKSNIDPKINFYPSIIAIISSFISIALPLSINQVAKSLEPHNDKEVTKMFFKEDSFVQMVSILIILIISLIIWYLYSYRFFTSSILLSTSILTIFYFYKFFKRVIEYITEPDDIVHDYFLKKQKKLLNYHDE